MSMPHPAAMRRRGVAVAATLCALAAGAPAQPAGGEPAAAAVVASRVEVTGHYVNAVGSSDAASAGTITPQLIDSRPLQRPGTLLELVPGVVVTQHSGAGKANQYFLRGFNLDHGTDFATWVAGMPVNLRTHAHGQGYTDLNFVIPELISGVDYWKGPYFAQIGDFSSAGGAHMHYTSSLAPSVALATLGEYGYRRALLAGSPALGASTLTYGLEVEHQDGPWDVPSDYRKVNGVLRLAAPLGDGSASLTAMGYDGRWTSTDQVPQRALDSGLIGRWGTLDASAGGRSERYSLSADVDLPLGGGDFTSTAYGLRYRLDLFSNFTYFLADPVNGDQFEQLDRRDVFGWHGEWSRSTQWQGRPVRNAIGFELRRDRIEPVGLYATRERDRLATVREDDVVEDSAGLWASNETRWSPTLRSVLGLRYDRYRFDVASSVPENSGRASAGLWSPKATLVLGPWRDTEVFANAGYGFHSNDARGVTIRVDPATGDAVDPATPLVRSRGAELGVRTEAIPGVQSSLSLWALKLDSELVFVGDAGTTEAGRPSRRYGVEWSTRWRPQPWMLVDLDVAWNHARFSDAAPEGDHVPGAPDLVVAAGVAVPRHGPWSAALWLRHIGSYPLIEDDSERSDAQTVVDAQVGYEIARNLRLRLDVLNVFDAKTNDITYFYESRLPGEPPEGVADRHVHPGEPRSLRVSLSYRF